MKKNLILSTFAIFALIIISGCSTINNRNNQKFPECYDCGQGGWEMMKEKCNQEISTKNDFKNCLINFTWSGINSETDVEEIEEGYIEINGTEISDKPTLNSIKVFIYHQWAVDENGNLYLLGQLG